MAYRLELREADGTPTGKEVVFGFILGCKILTGSPVARITVEGGHSYIVDSTEVVDLMDNLSGPSNTYELDMTLPNGTVIGSFRFTPLTSALQSYKEITSTVVEVKGDVGKVYCLKADLETILTGVGYLPTGN